MEERNREPVSSELEAEIARTCGVLNATTGHLVGLIAQVMESGCWQVAGIHSPTQWVAWQCGVSPARAKSLISMARRRAELPETSAAHEAGELCEDQVAVIARHAPAGVDAQVAELARAATVTQLRRVLGSYPFAEEPAKPDKPEPAPPAPPEEDRSVSFGPTESGSWRLSALLPPDEGALVERALLAARDELFRAGEGDPAPRSIPDMPMTPNRVSWADAFLSMAERSLGAGAAQRPHHERHMVLLHVGTDAGGATGAHLHLGPGLSEGLRRFLGCDARIRPVLEAGGKPVSVGRAFRTVPERTRITIEERDRGCRVPGCDRSRWLHVHHIRHWEDGGTTDTPNLIALCRRHHRLHHLGHLGIRGDADDPDGVIFTDHRGHHLDSRGRPVPPRQPVEAAAADLGIAAGAWTHPTGERLEPWAVTFDEPAA
ncbi:MAG TPA: DUF222 domain-containing protein [Acidimicrobiales bacterium]|nr:DUF222 domain-containing protein [Acidimicrobiales bacterium]